MIAYVLIFLWFPRLDGPPQVITQTFGSQRTCEIVGKILTREIDIPDTYMNTYGFDHRTKPKSFCMSDGHPTGE